MSVFKEMMQSYYKGLAKAIDRKIITDERGAKVYDFIGTKITCDELREAHKCGGVIIDLRNPVDYMCGGVIHNSINVPHKNAVRWVKNNGNINELTPIMLYSESGRLAQEVMKELKSRRNGYKNVHNIGSHKWYPNCS
jgi:rhodanese-related sulfurtransferase